MHRLLNHNSFSHRVGWILILIIILKPLKAFFTHQESKSIEEELPTGTFVFNFSSVLENQSISRNSLQFTIYDSFPDWNIYFSLNSSTGALTINNPLDYENFCQSKKKCSVDMKVMCSLNMEKIFKSIFTV